MAGNALRRGGRAVLPSGGLLVWSVADGRRGRRWREVTSVDGTVVRVVLLESAPAGRLVRLEIATAAGLLTLHPDRDGTALHGNVVTPTGVRHLTFDRLTGLVDGSPAAAAVVVAGLADRLQVDGTSRVDLVRVDDPLEPRAESWTVTRTEPGTWRLVDSAPDGGGGVIPDRIVRLDADGLPSLDGDAWPLEI
jgi:hypothetical protein